MSTPAFKFIVDSSILPAGFRYPSDYREFSAGSNIPVLTPWSFLWERELDSLANGLAKRFPDRSLIPFARRVDCDDMACFDGSDDSGNPVVHIIHDYASPGWEQRRTLKSFTDWLATAASDAAEWSAEQEEDA